MKKKKLQKVVDENSRTGNTPVSWKFIKFFIDVNRNRASINKGQKQ